MSARIIGRKLKQMSRIGTMATNSASDLEGEVIRSFISLESLDPNIFRAPKENLWHPNRSRFIFGGQVVGQALVAACNTVSPDHLVHSLHCYFLRGGNSNWPILYHVDRTRDGETYASRSVKATQDGKAIFTMQSSFKTDEKQVYRYTMDMPKVKGPEEYLDANEILKMRLDEDGVSDKEKEHISRTLAEEIPLLIRPTEPESYYRIKTGKPERLLWMRANGNIGDDNKLHQCVAAYMSDFSLLGTALQPGGPNFETRFMTSLDHTLWFHNPFRVDEWMLYESFSPHAGNGKALVLGRVWKQDGTLAMSVAQEGVVRNTPVSKM
ncbi:acyl-coenzyme A thioesterase 8-like isoform X1 [Ruditapes philippinarum]|uniref:acyl-coenzyme A thioesterase 8-like isoform X1 n=1 Tax=Ruditapes philippinarum TaxID=129788 RepID=UPI00295BC147|nr:acyl-coenzyme A thioesterase 8-like isoform X1 [Ruditapes philippinarum]